jgi:hypothetical protein
LNTIPFEKVDFAFVQAHLCSIYAFNERKGRSTVGPFHLATERKDSYEDWMRNRSSTAVALPSYELASTRSTGKVRNRESAYENDPYVKILRKAILMCERVQNDRDRLMALLQVIPKRVKAAELSGPPGHLIGRSQLRTTRGASTSSVLPDLLDSSSSVPGLAYTIDRHT